MRVSAASVLKNGVPMLATADRGGWWGYAPPAACVVGERASGGDMPTPAIGWSGTIGRDMRRSTRGIFHRGAVGYPAAPKSACAGERMRGISVAQAEAYFLILLTV